MARDDTQALNRILALATFLNADMDEALARIGLTQSRTHVVWFLHQGGPMTQRALADALAVSPRNVTGLVDALVETGFVTREPHPTDRRATLVTLTEHGTRTAQTLVREQAGLADALFGDVPDAEFDAFVTQLDRVLETLGRLKAEDDARRAGER